jgi:hypothetical protein
MRISFSFSNFCDVVADVAALATIKRDWLEESVGLAEGRERSEEAASFILDALATPELLDLAGENFHEDLVQFFQLLRCRGRRSERIVDIRAEINLIDLVARHAAAEDRAPIALAFADVLATGRVATSSMEGQAAGYAETEGDGSETPPWRV